MTITTNTFIEAILAKHHVPTKVQDGRLLAMDYGVNVATGQDASKWVDTTGWLVYDLYRWLGY
jgi:hypothetical protein